MIINISKIEWDKNEKSWGFKQNEIALFAEYRLSDMMKPYKPSIGSDILYPELPRLAVGLDIVF